jgi:monoamine oxidase
VETFCHFQTSKLEQMLVYDVIIVGAGLSGLSAAHYLLEQEPDLRVLIVEARDRVGGRLLTQTLDVENAKVHCDLGGQWVSKKQTHIMDMLELLDIGTYKQYTEGSSFIQIKDKVYTYNGIVPWDMSWLGLIELQYHIWRIDGFAKQIDLEKPWEHARAKEWDAITVQAYIDKMWTAQARDMFTLLCLTVCACEPNEISFFCLIVSVTEVGGINAMIDNDDDGAQDSKIEGGAQLVCTKLAERLQKKHVEIVLDSPVQLIENTQSNYQGMFKVTTPQKIYQSKFVVMALSPLLSSRIECKPALPSYRDQFCQRTPMACCIKTVTYFKTAWWRDDKASGTFMTLDVEKYPLTNGMDGTINNSIVGFILGNKARYWSTKTKQERQDAIVVQFAEMYNKSCKFIEEQLIVYEDMDWGMEQYTRGAFDTIFGCGLIVNFKDAITDPIGNLHYAGAETATRWSGYMSGAVEAGERVADEILDKI